MKEQAEIYRLGLMLGLFEVSEVIAWCDAIITAESAPDIGIIEASISGSSGAHVVADALQEVDGEFDEKFVFRQVLSAMARLIRQDRQQAPRIAWWLYQMASEDWVPDDDAKSEMWGFWDEIDLAVKGIYGDVDSITDELLQFLDRYSIPKPPVE